MHSEALDLTVSKSDERFGVRAKAAATCELHGDYVSFTTKYSDKPSLCPKCAEIRQQEAHQREMQESAARFAAEKLERMLGNSMIPKRFQGKSFDQFKADNAKQSKALDTCREYAENFKANASAGRCLILLGKPGTGKTHLATAIADHVIRHSVVSAAYRTVSGLLTYIKGSYDRDSDYSEGDAMKALAGPGLLIIDEVGATKPTEFEQAMLFQVINSRYEQMRPTIVISNLDPVDLPAVLGDRCVDRLREGGGLALVFDWASARRGIAS